MYKVSALLPLVIAIGLLPACSIPDTPKYPVGLVDDPRQSGAKFCADVEARARDLSNLQTGLAYATGILAAAAIGTGTYLTATNSGTDGTVSARRWGIGLTLGAVPLVYLSNAHSNRAQAAAALGQAADQGMVEKSDRAAYEKCVMAKGAWVGSKGDAAKLVETMNAELRKELEKEKKDPEGEQPAAVTSTPPALGTTQGDGQTVPVDTVSTG